MKYLPAALLALLCSLPLLAEELAYPLDAPLPAGHLPNGNIVGSRQAPPLPNDENKDLRRARNYPEQPPTIPHSIRGYLIDLNSNKCLSCHSRAGSERSQAPMISITHYMDRDGQALAAVAPRRYFCIQCHVAQKEVQPLVGNDFENIDQLLQRAADGTSTSKP
ncbi:MAG TPA: nitrate reductase cytochrome c-type subunit [Pseudomonas sp.]|nr:nitrate reductase cytochrome c-type subunit [Pseudomonas sp.]